MTMVRGYEAERTFHFTSEATKVTLQPGEGEEMTGCSDRTMIVPTRLLTGANADG